MKSWVKVALVTALFAVPAMALGQVIWPPAPGGPEPTAGHFPFFLFLAVFEALTFGLGISFLLFGFVSLKRALGGLRPALTQERACDIEDRGGVGRWARERV